MCYRQPSLLNVNALLEIPSNNTVTICHVCTVHDPIAVDTIVTFLDHLARTLTISAREIPTLFTSVLYGNHNKFNPCRYHTSCWFSHSESFLKKLRLQDGQRSIGTQRPRIEYKYSNLNKLYCIRITVPKPDQHHVHPYIHSHLLFCIADSLPQDPR